VSLSEYEEQLIRQALIANNCNQSKTVLILKISANPDFEDWKVGDCKKERVIAKRILESELRTKTTRLPFFSLRFANRGFPIG